MPSCHWGVLYIKPLLAYLCIFWQLDGMVFVATSEFALQMCSTQYEIRYIMLNILYFSFPVSDKLTDNISCTLEARIISRLDLKTVPPTFLIFRTEFSCSNIGSIAK